jgi:excisionase family DNA binding protein
VVGGEQKKLVDVKAVAKVLGVSKQCVYDLRRLGLVRAVRVGRLLRFDLADVVDRLTDRPTPAT